MLNFPKVLTTHDHKVKIYLNLNILHAYMYVDIDCLEHDSPPMYDEIG